MKVKFGIYAGCGGQTQKLEKLCLKKFPRLKNNYSLNSKEEVERLLMIEWI
jgi:hypothetical protein